MKVKFWLGILVLIPQVLSELSRIHVDPETGHFIDESGRVRLFHGINSVIKGFPWYDEKILDPARQKEISELGVNVIRLGSMWTGVQPEEGKINQTYLEILDRIVSDFEALGIYVILDVHQDVLWQAGPNEDKGYWGVPPWIKHKLQTPENLYPSPFASEPNAWECGYFTREIAQGFGQIYDNVNGVADDFAQFWKILAQRFNGRSSVLGYELFNEPGHGDVYKDLSLLLPGVAGKKSFQPLYEKLNKAIREVDDITLVFWEPALYSYFIPFNGDPSMEQDVADFMSLFTLEDTFFVLSKLCGELKPAPANGGFPQFYSKLRSFWGIEKAKTEINREEYRSILGTGFDNPPGGSDYKNRTVMSWHYYCWGIYVGSDEPYDPLKKWFCDTIMGPTVFDTVEFRRKEVGGGSFLTEFGVCYPNITNPDTVNTIECNAVLEEAEKHFSSWTYWDTSGGFTFWDQSGNLKEELVIYFARPYPMATAGRPVSLSFNVYTKVFQYQFHPDIEARVPTEIYIPALQYPDGKFQVSVSSNLIWDFSSTNPSVILVTPKSGEVSEKIGVVTITSA